MLSLWVTVTILIAAQTAECWLPGKSGHDGRQRDVLLYVLPSFFPSDASARIRRFRPSFPVLEGTRTLRKDKREYTRSVSIRDLNDAADSRPTFPRGTNSLDQRAELLIEEVKTIDGIEVFIKLEGLGGNRRRISGGLFIEAPPEAIWDVLTNYSSLSEYIPNIAESGSQLQPNGKIRIEQVGVISQTWNIRTKIVLEVTEEPYRRLTFSKIESREFLEFEGTYSIIEFPDGRTYLEYSVDALPLPILPIFLVQSKIQQEVPPMLAAVRTCANRLHQQQLREASMRRSQPPDGRRVGTAGGGGGGSETARKGPLTVHSLPSAAREPGGGWALGWLGRHRGAGAASPTPRPSSLPFASMASSVLEAAISLRKFLPGIKPLPGDKQE